MTTRLRQIRSSVEVAADTLHPEWRQLLDVIGQGSPRRYHGHPHEWVTMTSKPALALDVTYRHLTDDFNFQFIDECVLDGDVFPDEDPRRTPDIDPNICQACKELQSDDVQQNRCFCFPALFGGPKNPIPVQLFNTASGKNNGVVARCVSCDMTLKICKCLQMFERTDKRLRISKEAWLLESSWDWSPKASRDWMSWLEVTGSELIRSSRVK